MNKPFLNIDQQIELLESRGLIVGEHADCDLLQNGFYTVINGYKQFFLDAEQCKAKNSEFFCEGTTLDDILSLAEFDRTLRIFTFLYLSRIELMVKTVTAYVFSKNHPGERSYLERDNFSSEASSDSLDYMMKAFASNLDSEKNEPINHYKRKYNHVPLWVLINSLSFGHISCMVSNLNLADKDEVARLISKALKRCGEDSRYLEPKDLEINLDLMRNVRNLCAHDSRLFCAKLGGRRNIAFSDFILRMQIFLTKDDFASYKKSLFEVLNVYSYGMKKRKRILIAMGFGDYINSADL